MRSYAPPTPGARRCAFLLPPAAHARLVALAAREGRTVANVVQCLVLYALHLAPMPIPITRAQGAAGTGAPQRARVRQQRPRYVVARAARLIPEGARHRPPARRAAHLRRASGREGTTDAGRDRDAAGARRVHGDGQRAPRLPAVRRVARVDRPPGD